ncbi:MAG: MerR family transcriptional regulator [Anaerolineae bacterium]|nr:MerR family transcriptional regulator [Anaerolineae bacterium]
MNTPPTYTIQQASRQTGLPASTLRYYEDEGLLDSVGRAANGHRRYSEDDLRRVVFIQRLKLIGMSIGEIRGFLALYRAGSSTARQRCAILQAHKAAVQAQVDSLVEMMTFIDMKIGLYQQEEEAQHHEYEISAVG